jgi:hypothetical protein
VEQEMLTLAEHLSSPPVFSGVRVLLLPGKEPDSLNECIWFRLKNSAQCWATQQVLYKLFTFKIIPKLQLKLCTLYVVHFLPVLDFRAALNPSIVSADVVLVGS